MCRSGLKALVSDQVLSVSRMCTPIGRAETPGGRAARVLPSLLVVDIDILGVDDFALVVRRSGFALC